MFGKGPEAALLVHDAEGRIRRIFDLRSAPTLADRVNNSMPRLLTTSREMLVRHPEAVVRYLQTLIRTSRWALGHPREIRALIARECGVPPHAMDDCLEDAWISKLEPALSEDLMETVHILNAFLLQHAFIAEDFPLWDWVVPEPLAEARRRDARCAGPTSPPPSR